MKMETKLQFLLKISTKKIVKLTHKLNAKVYIIFYQPLKPSIGESRMEGIEPGTTKQPREGTEFEEPLEVDIEIDILVEEGKINLDRDLF